MTTTTMRWLLLCITLAALVALAVVPAFAAAAPPDGTRIAFTYYLGGNWQIRVIKAVGSGQTRLTNNPATDRDPAW